MRVARSITVRPRRGFTAMEVLAVVLIMSIVAALGVDTISEFEANQRSERAARETLAFFRYARQLAITTGKSAKVSISTTNNTVAVYWMSNGSTWDATPVTHSMASGGQLQLNLNTARELMGTSMTVTPNGTTAFVYGALGSCGTTGSIQFSYGSKSKTLTIPAVGDPQLN